MYKIPAYIKEEKYENSLEISSPLYGIRIKLTNKEYIDEYYKLNLNSASN